MLHEVVAVDVQWQNALSFLLTAVLLKGIVWCQVDRLQLVSSAGGLWVLL